MRVAELPDCAGYDPTDLLIELVHNAPDVALCTVRLSGASAVQLNVADADEREPQRRPEDEKCGPQCHSLLGKHDVREGSGDAA